MTLSESGAIYRTVVADGIRTTFWEAGDGEPLLLLHGGEFGSSAELGWERVFSTLAEHYRVIAPDHPGYGGSSKTAIFDEGRSWRVRHLSAFLRTLQIEDVRCVGNSLGAVLLLLDAAADHPSLPVSRLIAMCGGGQVLRNEHVDALFDYDCTIESMRRLVTSLFHQAKWPADDDYVTRRWQSSLLPGAWEAVAAARFRRPGSEVSPPGAPPDYSRIRVPALFIEGAQDKLLPRGWSDQLTEIVREGSSHRIENAGHCPQIECPDETAQVILDYMK